ncbi:MAG: outer-membrane lipoprotein carrier protein LolA [Hyphomicrobiaceae bacterium]
MTAFDRAIWIPAVAAALLTFAANATADDSVAAPPSSAVGSTATWNAEVDSTVSGITLDQNQLAVVGEVNTYFNDITDLKGSFLQTDAENGQSKGLFYIQKPGRFRFDYASPSTLVVLSDGEYLSFEEEGNPPDRYPLDSTPFGVLFKDKVDLATSAKIVELYSGDDLVTITLEDRSDDSKGRIKLFFARIDGKLELAEWVVTGPEGGDTRVELAELVRGEKADAKLFKLRKISGQAKGSKK